MIAACRIRRPVARCAAAACLWAATTGACARAQPTETLRIRGKDQLLRIYGTRGGDPVIVSSGDGGWIHLGPHVAEFLAARGFFVVGFDVRAYLAGFTSGRATLRAEEVPGDYRALAEFASRGTAKKPILIGVSEGAGLSVLAATDPTDEDRDRRRRRRLGLPNVNELGLAMAGLVDLRDARRAERADLQHGGDRRQGRAVAARGDPFDARRVRQRRRRPERCAGARVRHEALDRRRLRSPVQRQPRGIRPAPGRGDRLGQAEPRRA